MSDKNSVPNGNGKNKRTFLIGVAGGTASGKVCLFMESFNVWFEFKFFIFMSIVIDCVCVHDDVELEHVYKSLYTAQWLCSVQSLSSVSAVHAVQ